jgi:hypothetical protein
LVTIDEENFLVSNNWLATKRWWAIHTHLPQGCASERIVGKTPTGQAR